jgi:hypothetical protein
MPTNILERLASSAAQFLPSNPLQFLALRMAARLQDLPNLNRYLVLFEHFPKELLLQAYQEAQRAGSLGEGFFAAFRKLTSQGE